MPVPNKLHLAAFSKNNRNSSHPLHAGTTQIISSPPHKSVSRRKRSPLFQSTSLSIWSSRLLKNAACCLRSPVENSLCLSHVLHFSRCKAPIPLPSTDRKS